MVSTHAEPDGTFTLPNVPPGPYVLQESISPALSFAGPGSIEMTRAGEQALRLVVVGGGDVSSLTITTSLAGELEGTFARDPAATQPLPGDLSVHIGSTDQGAVSRMTNAETGTFRLAGLRGPVMLGVSGLPEGWAIKAIFADGVDVTDR